LFDVTTIRRLSAHFETLLSQIALQPDARLDHLEMQTDEERQQAALAARQRQTSRTDRLRRSQRRPIDLNPPPA
jgi:hypothetical protein